MYNEMENILLFQVDVFPELRVRKVSGMENLKNNHTRTIMLYSLPYPRDYSIIRD